MRRAAAALAAAGVLALAGCGGDDEKESKSGADTSATTQAESTDTATTTETAPPAAETEPSQTGEDSGGTKAPGEDQPGGAGDEVENTVPALITGRGGKLSPSRISVAPFIRIAIELRAGDGGVYELRGGGGTLQVGGPSGEDASTVVTEGLRPGRKLVLTGPQGRVTVTANADPGP